MNKADKSPKNTGSIVQIIGPVVDVEFAAGNLPNIYDALEIADGHDKLTLEVQQHLGENVVRALALGSTDGLKRETPVKNTEVPISVPVGVETLGRIFNVVGETGVGALALGSTDGLKKETPVKNTEVPISVPVGVETLGRIFNVVGETVDGKGEVKAKKYYPIHRSSPPLTEQETKPQI